MSTSYYGLSSTTVDVGNANNLTLTGGGASLVQTTGNQTFNFTGYMEVQAHGGSTGVHGAIGNPDGRGWLLDDSSLVGTTIPSGTWTALVKLFTSDVSANGDLYVRFYKLNIPNATYTAIATASLTGQTITTSGVAFTLSAAGVASTTFNTNESLYVDLWWDQTGGGSASTLMSVNVASTTQGVAGSSGGFEVQIPSGSINSVSVADSAAGADYAAFLARLTDTASASDAMTLGTVLVPVSDPAFANDQVTAPFGLPTIPPQAMPLISAGVPAYASNITYAPSRANDTSYGSLWRSTDIPSTSAPVTLTYDLSTVAAASRTSILVNLINEEGNMYLDSDFSQAASLFRDYQLLGNSAPGGTGSAPTTGWTPLVSVTGNFYPTKQHLLNFAGYNWLRLSVTASAGVTPNNDVSVQMDVHDAHKGAMDRWLFLGDSITLEGMLHPNLAGGDWGYGGAVCQLVSSSTNAQFYPATIDAGNGGMTTTWAEGNITGLLNGFSGGFVVLAFGTNDANQSFLYSAGDSHVTTYYNALLSCIDAALALNNIVIVPYVPWGSNNGGDLGANAQLFNQYVDAHLPTDRPQVLRGPDFWTYFQNNPSLIRDGIHPTYTEVGGQPSGYEEMHLIWQTWLQAYIYAIVERASGTDTVARANLTPVAPYDYWNAIPPWAPFPESVPTYGLYEGITPDGTETSNGRLNIMAEAGFTHVINYNLFYATSIASVTSYLNRAQSLGMKVWLSFYYPTFYNPADHGGNITNVYTALSSALGATDNASFVTAAINQWGAHPAVGGHYVGDEVATTYHDALFTHTSRIATLDPHHQRLLIQGGLSTDPTSSLQYMADCCDALGIDYYPYGDDALPLSFFTNNCVAVQNVCGQYRKRPHVVLQAFSWQQSYPPSRCTPYPACAPFPSLAQMRVQRDMALNAMQTTPPDVLWFYSYFNLVQWSDPVGAWSNTIRSIAPLLQTLT